MESGRSAPLSGGRRRTGALHPRGLSQRCATGSVRVWPCNRLHRHPFPDPAGVSAQTGGKTRLADDLAGHKQPGGVSHLEMDRFDGKWETNHNDFEIGVPKGQVRS